MDLDVICVSSLRLIRGVLIGQNWSATTLRCKMPNVRCNVKCLSEKWANRNLSLVLSDNFWGKSSSTNFPVYVCFLHQWKYRMKIVDVCPALKVSVTTFHSCNFSETFSRDVTYDNIESHKKQGFYPLCERCIFRKTTVGGQIELRPANLGLIAKEMKI